MSKNNDVPDHALPPPKTEEFVFEDWTLSATKCHIMGSKCEKPTICDGAEDLNIICAFCRFERSSTLPHLPDMIFDQNCLEIRHITGGAIRFTALDALACVSDTEDTLQVAHAEAWRKARDGCEFLKKVHKPYDWTYTTAYRGSPTGGLVALETDERIDLEKLKTREEIKFYEEVYLYEDELDDNGCTKCVVKLKSLVSGHYVQVLYQMRIRHKSISCSQFWLQHPMEALLVSLDEYTSNSSLNPPEIAPSIYKNPDLVWQYLPLTYEKVDKLTTQQTSIPITY
ncbi:unnamed protein product, partial [Meganyctiphanes norvegica]